MLSPREEGWHPLLGERRVAPSPTNCPSQRVTQGSRAGYPLSCLLTFLPAHSPVAPSSRVGGWAAPVLLCPEEEGEEPEELRPPYAPLGQGRSLPSLSLSSGTAQGCFGTGRWTRSSSLASRHPSTATPPSQACLPVWWHHPLHPKARAPGYNVVLTIWSSYQSGTDMAQQFIQATNPIDFTGI